MSYFDLGFLSQVQNKIPRSRLGSSSCSSSSSLLQTVAAVLRLSKHLLTFTRRLTDFIVSHLQLSGHIYLHTLLPLPTHPPFFIFFYNTYGLAVRHTFLSNKMRKTHKRGKRSKKNRFFTCRGKARLRSHGISRMS